MDDADEGKADDNQCGSCRDEEGSSGRAARDAQCFCDRLQETVTSAMCVVRVLEFRYVWAKKQLSGTASVSRGQWLFSLFGSVL